MNKIGVLNGPNLNLLGSRESDIYGSVTLAEIEQAVRELGSELGLDIIFMQTNHEGELVEAIHSMKNNASGIIINAAAYTHTSIAIHDALKSVNLPIIEVHLSNVFAREPFRHQSYISSVASGVICGFGLSSYLLAVRAIKGIIESS